MLCYLATLFSYHDWLPLCDTFYNGTVRVAGIIPQSMNGLILDRTVLELHHDIQRAVQGLKMMSVAGLCSLHIHIDW